MRRLQSVTHTYVNKSPSETPCNRHMHHIIHTFAGMHTYRGDDPISYQFQNRTLRVTPTVCNLDAVFFIVFSVATPIARLSPIQKKAEMSQNKNKNKNFIDPQTEIHSNIKFVASIFGKSKTNTKNNCACNMTFTSIIYSWC